MIQNKKCGPQWHERAYIYSINVINDYQIPTSPMDLISTKNLFSIQDKIYYLTIHSSGLQITIMLAGHLMAHSWLVYNTPTSQSCCGRLCRYCQHILGYTGQEEAQAHSAKCFRALRDSRPQRNADCHPSPLRWTQREVWANWDKYRLVW